VNEELDPALMIRRLKKEVAQLKDELTMISDEGDEEEFTAADMDECRKLVSAYLEETDLEAPFVCGSMRKFRESFQVLRQVYWQRENEGTLRGAGASAGAGGAAASTAGACSAGENTGTPAVGSLEATVAELRQQVARRDQEIGLLLNSLNKRSGKAQAAVKDVPIFIKGAPRHQQQPEATSEQENPQSGAPEHEVPGDVAGVVDFSGSANTAQPAPAPVDSTALLLDRNKAFEVFRKSVRRSETLEENKEAMKKLMEEGQAKGQEANAAREAINSKKTRIERMRMERALESNPRSQDSQTLAAESPEENALLKEIEDQKRIYHAAMERLKKVKVEMDSYKKLKQQSDLRLQRDFEAWFLSLQASQGTPVAFAESAASPSAAVASSTPSAARLSPEASGQVAMARSATSGSSRSEADMSARASPALGASRSVVVNSSLAATHAALEPGDRPLPAVSAWAAPPSSDRATPAQASVRASPSAARPPAAKSPVRSPSSSSVGTAPGAAATAPWSRPAAAPAQPRPAPPIPSTTSPGAAASKPPPAAVVRPASQPTPIPAATPTGVQKTGHEETDKEIAAYFEALAALNG